jgi:heptosyltransferase-2
MLACAAMLPPVPSCVAILRFSAAGDVMLVAPAIDALAAAWPTARLVMVTHARLAPLLDGHPRLHAVVGRAPHEGVWALSRRLAVHRIEAVCDLHGSWRSRALSALLRPRRAVRWRKRTLKETLGLRLGHGRYWPARSMEARLHDAVCTLVGQALPRPALVHHARPEDLMRGAAIVAACALVPHAPVVALLPGAAWATKRWPTAHFAAVARALLAEGVQVLAVGSAAEQPLTSAIAAAAPGVHDLGGQAGLGALAGVLRRCDAVLAGDTGPMHMARGLGVPTVALFGSTPPTQFELAPAAALFAGVDCSPCSVYGRAACPRGHLRCLTELSVPAALAALRAQLQRSVPLPR